MIGPHPIPALFASILACLVLISGCAKQVLEPVICDDTILIISDTFDIEVVHHVSRTNQGANPATDSANIASVMSQINANFSDWDIHFQTKEIRFLDNTDWNTQFVKQDDFIDQRVLLPFEDGSSLNIFYFHEIGDRQDGVVSETLGATALFPGQGNNIKLSASAFANENTATVTHEIGHYLGLFHTSDDHTDINDNLELVDGSNCCEAGDFICDTPASPDLNDSNIDESTCMYTGNEKDANGMKYSPDVFNYMTQWAGTDGNNQLCRRQFTPGQTAKMKTVLRNERAYLID